MNLRPYIMARLSRGPASSMLLFREVHRDVPSVEMKDVRRELTRMAGAGLIVCSEEDYQRSVANARLIVKHGLGARVSPVKTTWSLK